MHDCRTHHHLVPFQTTMSCFDRPSPFTKQTWGNIDCEFVLMYNLRVFSWFRHTCDIPCHMFWLLKKKIVKEHVVICYSKKFNMYTLPLLLLAQQEMFPFPSLPGNSRGHWVAVVRISHNQSIGAQTKDTTSFYIPPIKCFQRQNTNLQKGGIADYLLQHSFSVDMFCQICLKHLRLTLYLDPPGLEPCTAG